MVPNNFEESLDSFPGPWKPQPGDKLIGDVVSVDTRDGEYGTYPIVTVRTEAGDEFAFHAFHTVAKKELAALRPKPGDTIGIKYFGRDEDKGYERYRLKLDRPNDAPDWDAIGAEAGEDLGDEDEALAI